jgi:transposase
MEGSIAELDMQIDRMLAPFAQARDRLDTITGVGKRAAEYCSPSSGWTWRCSPPPRTWRRGRTAAWATTPTGGKRRSARPPGATAGWVRCSPGCAWAAARSRDSDLSAQYWRLARRIGKKKAALAVAHSILVIAWRLLTDHCDDQDLGGDYFVRRDTDRQRQRAFAQLQGLGDRVILEPVAA